MKFSFPKSGQLGLLLAFSVLASSCNKEDFFKAEEFLFGEDAFCYDQGPDLASCLQLPDRCLPAFLDSEDEAEAQEPEFFACLANPTYVPPSDGTGDGSTTGGTDGGTTGGTDGGTTGGTDGGTTGGTDGGTTGGTDGGTTGGTDGGTTGGTVETPPSIEEAYDAKCKNVAAKDLWTKKVVEKKKSHFVSKVKVCHKTGNGSSHTIVIACPALKPHIHHHDDYVGACSL